MNVGLQVFVGVVAGAVMLVRVAAAGYQAWLDGEIVARRARREEGVRKGLSEHPSR